MEHNNQTHVILGAGISGLLAGAVLARRGLSVVILETRSQSEHLRMVQARDRHAHVCVGKAVANLNLILPEFAQNAARAGIVFDDPGRSIFWSVPNGQFQSTDTGITAGYGSYQSFFVAIHESVVNMKRVAILYDVDVIEVNHALRTLSLEASSTKQTLRYEKLLVANGESRLDFLNETCAQTTQFHGRCLYQSFELKLKSPLKEYRAIINDAVPNKKPISYLYAPRSSTTGILTICNFGEVLKIDSADSLRSHLHQWRSQMPEDFIEKIECASSSTNYVSRQSYYRRSQVEDLHFVGDSALKVTPYLGLGLLAATECALALDEHLESGSNYEELLAASTNEIIMRMKRFDRLWSAKPRQKHKKWQSPARVIQAYLFSKALTTPTAARYFVRRFHLTYDSSYYLLVACLLRVIFEHYFPKNGAKYERISQTS